MKASSLAWIAAIAAIVSTANVARAGSAKAGATLLNKANQMDIEEQAMAKTLRSKAGDNQSLITMADTISGDHKANQDAVTALAKQKSIELVASNENDPADKKMAELNGAEYNRAFIAMDIRDHTQALTMFRHARGQLRHDPDFEMYIDQTIPVLEAHLKMAKNMRHSMAAGSTEDPSNNRRSDN